MEMHNALTTFMEDGNANVTMDMSVTVNNAKVRFKANMFMNLFSSTIFVRKLQVQCSTVGCLGTNKSTQNEVVLVERVSLITPFIIIFYPQFK